MTKRILFFVKYFLFWMLFFVIARLIFMIYNLPLSSSLTLREWLLTFLHGAHMDASWTGYLALAVAVILALTAPLNGKTAAAIISAFTMLILIATSILIVADMELYRHWGFRIDSTPLSYLKTPREAFGSASLRALAVQITVFALLVTGVWICYRRWLHGTLAESSRTGWWWGTPAFLFLGAAMILPIRGGLSVSPMNTGYVYFHPDNMFANHAAINPAWNAGNSLLNANAIREYRFMDNAEAERIFSELYPEQTHTGTLLREKRPNVIFIILESFSNRLIEPLGGTPGITPNLNALCREGILFSGMYSNSDRTDKGILGILNGYPVHPVAKATNFPEKLRQLPHINKDMSRHGYSTSFMYGGDILFANFASYLNGAGYDRLVSQSDFPEETWRGTKWGVPDHIVFERFLEHCSTSPRPFFNVCLALSSHEPFEVPMPTAIEGSDEESLFLNSAFYTDMALGKLIEAARQTDWWEHTVIVITADHGSRHPGNVPNWAPEKFHIPMLWIGGAVARADTVIQETAGQTDIALTVLHQLGIDSRDYRFSRDILGTPSNPFAFYDFNDGFGFAAGDTRIAFDNTSSTVIYSEGSNPDGAAAAGRAYLQTFTGDFLNRDRNGSASEPSVHGASGHLSAGRAVQIMPGAQSVAQNDTSLINILDADSTLLIDLKYASEDNFTGTALYSSASGAFLNRDAAHMLAEAHRYLKSIDPSLRLLVYDAVRPLSVQRIMYERVRDTPYHLYVASPDRLSLHNFGAAVDLTISDVHGSPLDMGTPFDFFGRAAGTSSEELLVEQGVLTMQQVQHRQLLRRVMLHAGFFSIRGEWWHFNSCPLDEAKLRYTLIE